MISLPPEKTVYLIDASSYLYRAYYSIKPLTTPEGEAVNAVFGFCRMLKKLIDTFDPHYLSLVWDSKGVTARHEEYPNYKATRQAAPDTLFTQKERIIQICDAIGIHQEARPGIEADDLLYSLSKDFTEQGFYVVVITADKDMGQLLTNDAIRIYDPLKEKLYDRLAYEERLGMAVDRILLYYTLVGDSSDNIPGVAGIGEKSALELVSQFATLEEVYARLDTITSKRALTALQNHKDDALLSEKLFKLRYYYTDTAPDALAFNKEQWNKAIDFFKLLNFKSLLSTTTYKASYDDRLAYWKQRLKVFIVTTEAELVALCAQLQSVGAFAIDTETDGRPPLDCRLVGISVACDTATGYYIPCGHWTGESQLHSAVIARVLGPLCADVRIKKYLQNTKFDQKVLSQHGIIFANVAHDTMIAASLVAPSGQRLGLKALSEFYLGEQMLDFADFVDGKKTKNFAYIPIADGAWYAAIDAVQTLKLIPILEKELHTHHVQKLYEAIELPITQVLYAMEVEGIWCDTSVLDQLRTTLTRRLARLEEDISHAAGLLFPINLNSPKQIQDLLFKHLRLPPVAKSASGSESTRHEVLVKLAPLHSVPRMLLEHREVAKLLNTYVDALPESINRRTGRIHTTYNQTGVATGRLSSTDPNLQNIPVGNSEELITVRSAFKAKPGYLFVSADYSQIELRILAYLSQDPLLIAAFGEGRDIHQETAVYLFDKAPDTVTHEERQIGKRVNFSVLYGVTPFGLAREMQIPVAHAKNYIDRYFVRYKGVAAWMASLIETAQKDGYVTTHWGRRRYIPAIREKNKVLFQEACRVAINTVAQGTAAEVVKRAMVAFDRALKNNNLAAHMLLQIHDEILVEATAEQADRVEHLLKEILETIVDWNVHLSVTTRRGADWQLVSK